ncbi:hypothetical protein Tco_0680099 [Tanacetum coccineum]|uniref:Uncharacterized protein n=1 Tax=Tanacetum coccineum TaxID=301880 RepID=A0ABQ4XJN5_9ASTR
MLVPIGDSTANEGVGEYRTVDPLEPESNNHRLTEKSDFVCADSRDNRASLVIAIVSLTLLAYSPGHKTYDRVCVLMRIDSFMKYSAVVCMAVIGMVQ